MTWSDALRFAIGALRSHRLRSLLSLLGVGIGVGSVILLTSLGEGARRYVVGEFAALGSNLLIVVPGKTETSGLAPLVSTAPHDLTYADAEALAQRVPAIGRVAPVMAGTATVVAGDRRREVMLIGSTRDLLEIRRLQMNTGRYLPRDAPEGAVCVLGAKVQQELFSGRNPLGQIVRVGDWRFRVIGVIAPRGMSIGMDLDEVVHIPVKTAMRLFNRSSLFRILAEVPMHAELDQAADRARAVLSERHAGEEDVTVLTQDSILTGFSNILRALTAALAGIAAVSLAVGGIGAISLLVGAIGILTVMWISVNERTTEIGLARAVGATPRQVQAMFLTEATVLSTLGGILGLGIGMGLAQLLQIQFPALPVHTPATFVVAALVVSLAVGLLSGLLPARRASSLDPIAALAEE